MFLFSQGARNILTYQCFLFLEELENIAFKNPLFKKYLIKPKKYSVCLEQKFSLRGKKNY